MARIFLFPSESYGPCSNKLAESITENLKTNLAIGELQIEDQIFGDDFTPILVPKSAFQGSICHVAYFVTPTILVNLIIPGARYLTNYRKMWDKETLKLTDDFYSILRTLYR